MPNTPNPASDAPRPVGWRYKVLVNKHSSGSPLAGEISMLDIAHTTVWGIPGGWQYSDGPAKPNTDWMCEAEPLYGEPAQPVEPAPPAAAEPMQCPAPGCPDPGPVATDGVYKGMRFCLCKQFSKGPYAPNDAAKSLDLDAIIAERGSETGGPGPEDKDQDEDAAERAGEPQPPGSTQDYINSLNATIAQQAKKLHLWNREMANVGLAGSEFHDDPKRCAARFRQHSHTVIEQAKKIKAQAEQLAALQRDKDAAWKVIEALPLDAFDKEMASIDAAEFVDASGAFMDAMQLARAAIAESRSK